MQLVSVRFSVAMVGTALGALVLNSAPVLAIPVSNFSFETPQLTNPPGFSSGSTSPQNNNPAMPGWGGFINISGTTFGSQGVQDDSFATNGSQAGYVNGGHGNSVYQDVGSLAANTFYTLTISAGGHPAGFGNVATGQFELVNGTDQTGTPLIGTPATFNALSPTLADLTATFTTGPVVSGDLTIVISNTTVDFGVTPNQIVFDNVRLTAAPVPEPATIGLLALTGTSMLARRRRR